MLSIRRRLQRRKFRNFISRVQPVIIGVTGVNLSPLAAHAIGLVLHPHRQLATSLAEATGNARAVDTLILTLPAPAPGAVDRVVAATPFSIGVVTDMSSAHLDVFASKSMLAHELTSLPISLTKDGIAIVNSDDELTAAMAAAVPARVVQFGTNAAADVRLIRSRPLPRIGFAIEIAVGARHFQGSLPYLIHFPHVYAALAALSVAHAMNLDVNQSLQHLAALRPLPGQLDVKASPQSARILDGSAFATPESMHAALHTLHTRSLDRRIAVLGDIESLGVETTGAHKRIGRAAVLAANIFIAVGRNMRLAGAEALRVNHGPDVHHFDSAPEVGEWLAPYVRPDDTILVMGSPEMEMQAVVADLCNSA